MEDKIKRQKIMERDRFTYEDKLRFAAKSDDRCCHCGKKVHIGYGATVEHFVPLSQGGTNREINMVMLCEDCNKNKGSFIYRPEDYLLYLKKEHLDKLQGYFDSYINSFDFVNRDNLLACDRYKVWINTMPEQTYYAMKARKRRKGQADIMKKCSVPLWVKRATYDDIDKLTEYFIKYLKKYNCLDSEESAKINIQFWISFGCIYYIERNGNIESFVTVTITKANGHVFLNDDKLDYYLTVNVFTYYSNEYALTLGYNLSRQIPRYLSDEQNLKQIPIKYCVIADDTLSSEICDGGSIYRGDRFVSSFMVLYDGEKNDLPSLIEDKELKKFFQRFDEIKEERLKVWFAIHGEKPYEWMMRELELKESEDTEDNDNI